MLRKLRSLFFSVGPARESLARVRSPHYRLTGGLFDRRPPALADLTAAEVARINRHSDEYFDDESAVSSWEGKPLSDLHGGADSLWRFGLLVSALRIRPEDRILDFGCGTGWTSAMLVRTGAEVTGMDISAHALRIGRAGAERILRTNEGERLRFERFDGVHIDAPDGHYDFVVVLDALHHLPNPVAVLRECCRVLGPYGCLGFAEPGLGHSETHTARAEAAYGVLEGEVDPEQWRNAGLAAGFVELDLIVPPVPPNILTLPMPRARWYLRGLPWIVPHDYIRAAMLSSPIGILRKSVYPSTSLHPHVLIAEISPVISSITASPGAPFSVSASVRNPTGTVWLKAGRRGAGAVRLGARVRRVDRPEWLDAGSRAELPRDMLQGDECVLHLAGHAPEQEGEYRIRLDMVDEGIAWFEDQGSRPVEVRLDVRRSAATG